MLNHSTVKIDHIKTTIRTHRCIDRTESFISTGQKFPLFPNRIGIELMNIFIGCRERFFRKKGSHGVGPRRHGENSSFPILTVGSMTMHCQTTDSRNASHTAVLQDSTGTIISIQSSIWTNTIHSIRWRFHAGTVAWPLTIVSCPIHFEPITIGIESITDHRHHLPIPHWPLPFAGISMSFPLRQASLREDLELYIQLSRA